MPAILREQCVRPGDIEASYIRDYEEAMKRRPMSDYNLNTLFNADYGRGGLEAAQRCTRRSARYLIANGCHQA